MKIISTMVALAAVAATAILPACAGSVSSAPWGETKTGKPVTLYTLKNDRGMVVKITNYGAIITSIRVPDRRGKMGDIVLGYDRVSDYIKNSPYFGAVVGRYGNRIGHAQFTLDGTTYHVSKNDGDNSLHGGQIGFDKALWNASPAGTAAAPAVALAYLSRDGEEGYPGNLRVKVVYTIDNRNELKVDYTATTDRDTVLNLTNHSYWNLAGAGEGTILHDIVMIDASHYTPVDSAFIPTGDIAPVTGTPFDFRAPAAIGARIGQANAQLKNGLGYDHNFVLDRRRAGDLELAARVFEPGSGRVLEVWTSQPGLQFYTGNFLDGTIIGKGGKRYQHRGAIVLETQHFPDSPNHAAFPSTELKPGQVYRQTTVFKFRTR